WSSDVCSSDLGGVREAQDLGRDLTGLGELRIAGAGAFRGRCLRGRVLDRELVDHAQHLIRVLGREARDTDEVLALQVNDIQERSIPRTLEGRQSRERQLQLAEREIRHLVLLLPTPEQRLVRASLEPLAAAVQVDLPAQQLARQADVLPVPAD